MSSSEKKVAPAVNQTQEVPESTSSTEEEVSEGEEEINPKKKKIDDSPEEEIGKQRVTMTPSHDIAILEIALAQKLWKAKYKDIASAWLTLVQTVNKHVTQTVCSILILFSLVIF
jgi:hypothetical protein